MDKKIIVGIYIIIIFFVLAISGCVAPPKEQQVIPANNSDLNPGGSLKTPTPTVAVYVTQMTPFVFDTPVETKMNYNIPLPTTEIPVEKSCRIYTNTQTYAYNGSAFTFNLKNPPMFINYSVIPTNYTEKREITSRSGEKGDKILAINTYSPQSWLTITVRNKTTGEIYLQDGFQNNYGIYLKNTLKVNKRDDLLIEIKGNMIKATVSVWVKPDINFDDPQQVSSGICTVIEQTRASLPYATLTPTPTWTGERTG